MSWHQTTVIGHIGADPTLNHTSQGKAVCNFSVAVNDRWYDRQTGIRREKTTWYRVTAWGERARNCKTNLSKGRKVKVTGNVSAEAYISNNGQLKASLNLTAHDVIFIEIGGRDRRERKHSNTEQIKNVSTRPAQHVIKGPVATQSDRRVATKAAKRKPRNQGHASKTDKAGNSTIQANQRLEVKQIRAELGVLRNKQGQLTRLMRNVTYRGGKKSKNADYHDTKEQLIAVEDRIQFYEQALASVLNSRTKKANHIIQIGSTVIIRYDYSNKDEGYTIVSTPLSKRSESTISANSPTGAALLGKQKGDKVRVQTPNGNVKLRVVDVH